MLVEQFVEVTHHLLQRLSVLRQVFDAAAQVAELLVHYIAPQPFHRLFEQFARLRGSPVVVLQLLHGSADIIGNVVDEGFAEARIVGRIGK